MPLLHQFVHTLLEFVDFFPAAYLTKRYPYKIGYLLTSSSSKGT